MDKNIILAKMEEAGAEFQKLQQRKAELQQEIIKCEQTMMRLDGKYEAYATLLKELETTEQEIAPAE
jgi:predicted nuclease with TOPRIM domain